MNTKNYFTHRILIDFPQCNMDTFFDMAAYTDMVTMGLQKISGIKEVCLQKISTPFTDQYIYQMVVDAVIQQDGLPVKAELENFCRYHNLTLNTFENSPVFATQVNYLVGLVGCLIIFSVLYFFVSLLKLALAQERYKIHTLQMMGAPRHMIGLLFQKEVKRLIFQVVLCGMLGLTMFYAFQYYKTSTKAVFFSQISVYVNTLLIPISVAIVTTVLAKIILSTQIPGEHIN